MTDTSYVGTDFELRDLIDAEMLDDTRAALEELLTASRLAGKSGPRDRRTQSLSRPHP